MSASRNVVSYDIPKDLDDHLDAMARQLSVPVSQVARWMLLRGLEHTTETELLDALLPSRSMRYQFVLFPPEGASQPIELTHRASPKRKR